MVDIGFFYALHDLHVNHIQGLDGFRDNRGMNEWMNWICWMNEKLFYSFRQSVDISMDIFKYIFRINWLFKKNIISIFCVFTRKYFVVVLGHPVTAKGCVFRVEFHVSFLRWDFRYINCWYYQYTLCLPCILTLLRH